MSSSADYIGRTVDIAAWRWPVTGNGQLSPSLMDPDQSGSILTGIGKLVQRFLLELLTEQGSMLYDSSRGCLFMQALRLGTIRTALDAQQSFNSALIDIARNLQADQLATDPLDEQYAGASLTSLTISDDVLTASVYITSQAGVGRNVILPIPTSITGG